MASIEETLQTERRDFLKKSFLVAGTGIFTLINPKNSLAFDFWDKILSFKKYPINFKEAKIGDILEFILLLNDPDGNEIKKEQLTVKTESDNESFLKWEIASGNPEKTSQRINDESYVEHFLKYTPIEPCSMFVVFPEGVQIGKMLQYMFSVSMREKKFGHVKEKDLFWDLTFKATKKGLDALSKKAGPLVEKAYKNLFEYGTKNKEKRAKTITEKLIERTGPGYWWAKTDFFLDTEPIETARYFYLGFNTKNMSKESGKILFVVDRPSLGIAGDKWGFGQLEKTLLFEGEIKKEKPMEFYNFEFSKEIKENSNLRNDKFIHNNIDTLEYSKGVHKLLDLYSSYKYANLIPFNREVEHVSLNLYSLERKNAPRYDGVTVPNIKFNQLLIQYKTGVPIVALEKNSHVYVEPSDSFPVVLDFAHGRCLSRFFLVTDDVSPIITSRPSKKQMDYSLIGTFLKEIGKYVVEKDMRFLSEKNDPEKTQEWKKHLQIVP